MIEVHAIVKGIDHQDPDKGGKVQVSFDGVDYFAPVNAMMMVQPAIYPGDPVKYQGKVSSVMSEAEPGIFIIKIANATGASAYAVVNASELEIIHGTISFSEITDAQSKPVYETTRAIDDVDHTDVVALDLKDIVTEEFNGGKDHPVNEPKEEAAAQREEGKSEDTPKAPEAPEFKTYETPLAKDENVTTEDEEEDDTTESDKLPSLSSLTDAINSVKKRNPINLDALGGKTEVVSLDDEKKEEDQSEES
jgi:hypothetical protein